jgi:pyruvate dehydrogenase E2 component (dihydrolipoamide acetyltransferase)
VPAPSPSSQRAGGDPTGDDLVEVRWTAARRATERAVALSASTTAPVTLHRRAGADAAMAATKRLKAGGLPATFTHAVLAVTARALVDHPALNAVWDGDRLLRSRRRHIGLAVDDGGDLLLGVVADADARDTTGLVLGAVEAVARARAREAVGPGPTFTVSNLGMFGVEQFTPIISPPAVAVLGVGAVVDGRCHLSLTFDHRAVDGAPAARFLADVVTGLSTFDGR